MSDLSRTMPNMNNICTTKDLQSLIQALKVPAIIKRHICQCSSPFITIKPLGICTPHLAFIIGKYNPSSLSYVYICLLGINATILHLLAVIDTQQVTAMEMHHALKERNRYYHPLENLNRLILQWRLSSPAILTKNQNQIITFWPCNYSIETLKTKIYRIQPGLRKFRQWHRNPILLSSLCGLNEISI